MHLQQRNNEPRLEIEPTVAKQCQVFKVLTLNAALVSHHLEGSNFEKVDRYFVDVLAHLQSLQRRYEYQRGTLPPSSISDSQWEWLKAATSETPLKNRRQLVEEGWHLRLLQELRSLEKIVQHA
jgi:hypothetical protein